jgi:hypothetical protein
MYFGSHIINEFLGDEINLFKLVILFHRSKKNKIVDRQVSSLYPQLN